MAKRGIEDIASDIATVQTVLNCTELQATLDFFTAAGFRVDSIYPADDPKVADLFGHGHRLRLERQDTQGPPTKLRLCCASVTECTEIVAPNGTILQLAPTEMPLIIPKLQGSLVLSHGDEWGVGRAGMRYRDLIPGRWGGRFIASLIHIPDAGPVPDYVHFHNVRFQFIYVVHGWARVVYEDQGEPFVMNAGDCVLQPPKIRHRVLEASADLKVVEVGCPAEHETRHDPDLTLPTGKLLPEKVFGGQLFCFHVAQKAGSVPWRHDGFKARDTGIGAATGGIVGVRVVKPETANATPRGHHKEECLFSVLLQGQLTLRCEGHPDQVLKQFDACTIPADLQYNFESIDSNSEWLEVSVPADLQFHHSG